MFIILESGFLLDLGCFFFRDICLDTGTFHATVSCMYWCWLFWVCG